MVAWAVTVQDGQGRLVETQARNITLEGMLIALDETVDYGFAVGDKVELTVEVPQDGGQSMLHRAPATIVHMRDRGAGLHFQCFSRNEGRELERELYNCMYPGNLSEETLHAA